MKVRRREPTTFTATQFDINADWQEQGVRPLYRAQTPHVFLDYADDFASIRHGDWIIVDEFASSVEVVSDEEFHRLFVEVEGG
jgi:hypothetical protein